jgi:hypothetical protein
MKKIKKGDVVELTFLDHCRRSGMLGPAEPMVFYIFGKVVEDAPVYYTIAVWIEVNGTLDENTEIFTILKSAVVKARVLR